MKSNLTSRPIKSSLALQVLLHINAYFNIVYFTTTLGLLIYKSFVFLYADNTFGLELTALIPFMVLEFTRFFIGHRANKMEEFQTTLYFIALTVVSLFVFLFYGLWQSYVLFVDLVICIIGVIFVCSEGIGATFLALKL